MTARQVYRWRLVDAGIHEPIGLRITRLKDQTVNASELLKKKWEPKGEKNFIDEQCEKGDAVSQFEAAADGLTHEQIVKRDRTVLLEKDQEAFIKARLMKAADDAFEDATVRTKVRADLENMKTTAFAPHKNFAQEDLDQMDEAPCLEKTGRAATDQTRMLVKEPQCVAFYAGTDPYSTLENPPVVFRVNGRSFDSNEPPRTLYLHIHVNPFQVIKIMKLETPKNEPKRYREITDFEKEPKDDAYYDYVGVKGTWRDTLVVRKDYKIVVATEYKRYIGDFVFHCHLLDHEDQGMMESVRIVPADSEGQPVPTAHAQH